MGSFCVGNALKRTLTINALIVELTIQNTSLIKEVSLENTYSNKYQTFLLSSPFWLIGEMEIANLGVRCDNLERGCSWEGTVATLDNHVEACPFTLVACPNDCRSIEGGKTSSDVAPSSSGKDDWCLMRKDLEGHLGSQCPKRLHSCEHCSAEGKYEDMTTSHLKICPKLEISCSNDECELKMHQEKLEDHLESCPYTQVDCKYKEIGCSESTLRKDIEKHEKDIKGHLESACSHVEKMMDTIKDLKKTKSLLEEYRIRVLKNGEEATFKVGDYALRKANDGIFTSDPFNVLHGGYKMCIKIYPNGSGDGSETHVSALVEIMKGAFDADISWPFEGRVSLKLLNQNSDTGHISRSQTYYKSSNLLVGSSFGFSQFLEHSDLSPEASALGNDGPKFLANDHLYFRVMIEVLGNKQWLNCNLVTRGERDEYGTLEVVK